jgi:hypothetical protein
VSANPRIVLADITINHDGEAMFIRHGTMIDAAPGSAEETLYGGPSNLRHLTAGEAGDGESSDRGGGQSN